MIVGALDQIKHMASVVKHKVRGWLFVGVRRNKILDLIKVNLEQFAIANPCKDDWGIVFGKGFQYLDFFISLLIAEAFDPVQFVLSEIHVIDSVPCSCVIAKNQMTLAYNTCDRYVRRIIIATKVGNYLEYSLHRFENLLVTDDHVSMAEEEGHSTFKFANKFTSIKTEYQRLVCFWLIESNVVAWCCDVLIDIALT